MYIPCVYVSSTLRICLYVCRPHFIFLSLQLIDFHHRHRFTHFIFFCPSHMPFHPLFPLSLYLSLTLSLCLSLFLSHVSCHILGFLPSLISALAFCHANGVVHRDIKGKNILVDTRGNCKLCDFGSAKQFQVRFDCARALRPLSA